MHHWMRCREHGEIIARCRCPEGAKNIADVSCAGTCKALKEEQNGELGN